MGKVGAGVGPGRGLGGASQGAALSLPGPRGALATTPFTRILRRSCDLPLTRPAAPARPSLFCRRSRATRKKSMPWLGRPTAPRWPRARALRTAQCGRGTRPPARRFGCGARRLWAGGPAPQNFEHDLGASVLAHSHAKSIDRIRPCSRHAGLQGPLRLRHQRGVVARRPRAGLRVARQDRAAMGRPWRIAAGAALASQAAPASLRLSLAHNRDWKLKDGCKTRP